MEELEEETVQIFWDVYFMRLYNQTQKTNNGGSE